MNQVAAEGDDESAEKPKNEKNNDDCPKHGKRSPNRLPGNRICRRLHCISSVVMVSCGNRGWGLPLLWDIYPVVSKQPKGVTCHLPAANCERLPYRANAAPTAI